LRQACDNWQDQPEYSNFSLLQQPWKKRPELAAIGKNANKSYTNNINLPFPIEKSKTLPTCRAIC
jgi:hypothetical protein